jgi:hypothetical protein
MSACPSIRKSLPLIRLKDTKKARFSKKYFEVSLKKITFATHYLKKYKNKIS